MDAHTHAAGRTATLAPHTRLECKICWQVYDPAEGDPVWQIPPGTAFADLPAHWTCPNCAATQDQFLVLDDGADAWAAPAGPVANAPMLADPSSRFVAAFRDAATRMTGLGFCNPALDVEAIGFAPWAGHWLGIVVTPWFMNLTLAPRDPALWSTLKLGEKRRYRLPAGDYDFIGAQDAIAGEYQACSLFSPMFEFADQSAARLVAQLARNALFDAAHAEVPEMPVANLAPAATADGAAAAPGPLATIEATLAAPMSKRDFLRGRKAATGDASRG